MALNVLTFSIALMGEGGWGDLRGGGGGVIQVLIPTGGRSCNDNSGNSPAASDP